MSQTSRRSLLSLVLVALAATAFAQQPPQPAPPQTMAPAQSNPPQTGGDLTVKLLSDLQKEAAIADVRNKVDQAKGRKRAGEAAQDEKSAQCTISSYQLLAVYGLRNQLRADIVLCGTAVLTVSQGHEVGDGWKVANIQTSHVTVARGKQIKQIWMPVPKDQLPTPAPTTASSGPLPLPPLPTNLAPSPYRASPERNPDRDEVAQK